MPSLPGSPGGRRTQDVRVLLLARPERRARMDRTRAAAGEGRSARECGGTAQGGLAVGAIECVLAAGIWLLAGETWQGRRGARAVRGGRARRPTARTRVGRLRPPPRAAAPARRGCDVPTHGKERSTEVLLRVASHRRVAQAARRALVSTRGVPALAAAEPTQRRHLPRLGRPRMEMWPPGACHTGGDGDAARTRREGK